MQILYILAVLAAAGLRSGCAWRFALAAAWACAVVRRRCRRRLCRTFAARLCAGRARPPMVRDAPQLLLPLETRSAHWPRRFHRGAWQPQGGRLHRFLARLAGAGGGALWPARLRQVASRCRVAAVGRRVVLAAAQLEARVPSPPAAGGGRVMSRPARADRALFALLERGTPLLLTARAAGRMALGAAGLQIARRRASGLSALGARRRPAVGHGAQAVRRPPGAGSRNRGGAHDPGAGALARAPSAISWPGPMPRRWREKRRITLSRYQGLAGDDGA